MIAELIEVKGIGRWTAEMFLIFHLGRPDVISAGDLGIRRAIQIAYGLEDLPGPTDSSGSPSRGGRSARSPASISGARSTTRPADRSGRLRRSVLRARWESSLNKRLPFVLAAVLAAALIAAGCGDDDETTSSTTSSTGASGASGATGAGGDSDVVAQVNQTCEETDKEIDDAFEQNIPSGEPSPADLEKAAKAVVPVINDALDQMRAVDGAEDDPGVSAFIDAAQKTSTNSRTIRQRSGETASPPPTRPPMRRG